MTLSEIQTKVVAALEAKYPGIVLKDDGLQRDKLMGLLNVDVGAGTPGPGRAFVVSPVGSAGATALFNGQKLDLTALFTVSFYTNPEALRDDDDAPLETPVANPQDELADILIAVCSVGRGPSGRSVLPHGERCIVDGTLPEVLPAWTYVFTFTVKSAVSLNQP